MEDPCVRRIHLVFLGFFLFLGIIVVRLLWIQALHPERFNNPTGIRYQHYQSVPASKGRLLDAAGRPLASCAEVWSIAANPLLIDDADRWAHRLAGLLDTPESVLRERLRQRLRPVVLREGLPPALRPSLQPLVGRDLLRLEEYTWPATFSVLVWPRNLEKKAVAVAQLARLLGLASQEVNQALSTPVSFVCLAQEVDATTASRLRFLKLRGVEVREQPAHTTCRVVLTPHPSDVRWTVVPQRGDPTKKILHPVLRAAVWQDLAPVWRGMRPPVKEQLEVDLKRPFVYLQRQVSPDIARQVRKWKEEQPGLIVHQERIRVYPFGDLAQALCGRTDVDEHGISGLEMAYDRVLSGVAGYRRFTVDAWGQPIPQMQAEYVPPVEGQDVVLTLDARIQEFAEAALAQALADNEAEWGVALVLDPHTGAILALANDLRGQPRKYVNRALSHVYEPGSVLKPITVSIALEEGIVRPDSTFYCGGVAQVGHSRLHCISFYTARHAHGTETVSNAVRDSCNVTLLQIGLQVGQKRFKRWYERFHLFDRSGLSVVEQEAMGGVFTHDPEDRWSPQKIATVSYGKGIQLTALALARAYCPIVNGGDLPSLRLVQRLLDHNGATVVEAPREVERGIIHPETAAAVREMLHRVVWDKRGTGHPAQSDFYETAGKTGTSPGYRHDTTRVVSFLGFAPYRQPRIICSVLVANPGRGSRTGSGTCGPAFRAIVDQTLDYLGVPPETERIAELRARLEEGD